MERMAWPVDAYWKIIEKQWVQKEIDEKKCSLLIQGTQLMLIEEGTVLEIVCLLNGAGRVSVTQSNAWLGVCVALGKKIVQKFKIRVAGTGRRSNDESCDQVVRVLEKFLPVQPHPTHKGKKNDDRRVVKTLPEMVKEMVTGDPEILEPCESLLSDFDLMDKLLTECTLATLDPSFPRFLKAVEKHFLPIIHGPGQQEDEDME